MRPDSSAGISPVSWLLSSHSSSRLDRLPSSAGIGPVSWLNPMSNVLSWVRLDSSEGMSPVSSLPSRYSSVRLDSSPSEEGISPSKLLSERCSSITRPYSSVVTPHHSPMSAPLSQLSLLYHSGPSVALYRSTSTSMSGDGVGGIKILPSPLTVSVNAPDTPAS